MPKKVDHQERRERIAAALMRVAANQGLEAVSLRHVAAEAGVTSGMVQHYFPSKDAMMEFAMRSAGARYEARMTAAVAGLGDAPAARGLVGAMLKALLPLDESERADGRVALAFMSYAATRRAASGELSEGDAGMRAFIAEQLRAARSAGPAAADVDPERAATALFAMTEGLAIHVLSSGLPPGTAVAALEAQLDLLFGDQAG
ncbi:TetR/AcrR family transcriptional regulator [Streptomyces mayteni]